MAQSKVGIAKEDKDTIFRSLVSLANQLKPWTFRLLVGSNKYSVSPDALKKYFERHFAKATEQFLEKERQEGKPWTSITAYIKATPNKDEQAKRANTVRLMAWGAVKGKLLEGLCLMAILSKMEAVSYGTEVLLFEQEGPLQVRDGDKTCFVWTQQLLESVESGLKARPDIVITRDGSKVTTKNILSVTECKCRGTLTADDIRGQFGKAYDLGSPSYTIVSYNAVPESLVNAAKELGIELQVFSLNTKDRERFIRGELDVGNDMATRLAVTRTRRQFQKAIEHKASELRRHG